jgi:hypothetical protein
MERQPHDESLYQPSLVSYVDPGVDEELNTTEKTVEEVSHPNDFYIALDRLLDAVEELLRGDYPLSDELRQRLSNPTLEALIFDEMNKSLKLE